MISRFPFLISHFHFIFPFPIPRLSNIRSKASEKRNGKWREEADKEAKTDAEVDVFSRLNFPGAAILDFMTLYGSVLNCFTQKNFWKWIYENSYIWTAEERMNKWMIIAVIYAKNFCWLTIAATVWRHTIQNGGAREIQ